MLGIPSLRNVISTYMLYLISMYDIKENVISIFHSVKVRVSMISLFNVKMRFKSDHLLPRFSGKESPSLIFPLGTFLLVFQAVSDII